MSSSSSSSPSSSFSCHCFTLYEIKEATDNFDEEKVIGRGGEGKVYLANIYLYGKNEKTPVAVKHLKPNSSEFEKEIQTISKIHHPNLVSLLGYCQESGQKILVYEYMQNGSLSDYVKKKKIGTTNSLPWKRRLNICIGAARGLQHLHTPTEELPKGIIHRDIKPANILLDKNWVAKVSDFGLFKLSHADQTNSAVSTNPKGTRGYFAPESFMHNKISRKIDVYAFGVVMFEVLCRKSPWDRGEESYFLTEEDDLGLWARENVDSEIKEEISGDSLHVFTDIIRRCLQRDPTKRPTMDHIVLDLERTRGTNSNIVGGWRYDVFLSFRREDVSKTFVGHLHSALFATGLQTFKDDQRLRTGDSIPEKLPAAIEESRIAVVIFSENYANSAWCLDEVVHINDCRKEIGQTIIPVFYDVDPSVVRHQRGVYDKAFQQHKIRHGDEKIQRWKSVLSEIANLSGFHLRTTANGISMNRDESECIKNLVQFISSRCIPIKSGEETNLVGINTRVQRLKSILRTEPNDVRFIGIWGMGGIGKTTLASATYLQISKQFECSSFVERVGELSKRDGLPSLQEKVLSDILFDKDLKVKSLAEGKGLMSSRMKNRKVLVVLDDVDDIEHLEALAADAGWFGKGSRIIITTRDKIWLERPTIKCEIYNATLLNQAESVQLFSLYAFGVTNPPEDYKDYSTDVVHYASGLPLVLKVLGSTLCGSTKDEWDSALSKLEAVGENKVFESLKISFDGLMEIDRKIFLDIACFFRGMAMDYVTRVLDSFDLHSHFGIKRLIQKSLIWISSDKELQMHDKIQELGWHIVWGVSVDRPGNHSRLWLREHICDVFRNNSATNAIEGVSVGSVRSFEVGMESFKKMNRLRLLTVEPNAGTLMDNTAEEMQRLQNRYWFSKAITKCLSEMLRFIKCRDDLYLPNSLRWLTWNKYLSPSLPKSFEAANLVGLEMRGSLIVRLWKGRKNLDKLRYLNLGHSLSLKVSPDIGWMPNLRTLKLNGCWKMTRLHPSFAYHEQLVFLSCEGCSRLSLVPSGVEMKSLETLIFAYCSDLGYFPDVKNMKRLSELNLQDSGIKELPESIFGELSGLVHLDLNHCTNFVSLPSTICGLKSLRTLNVSGCRNIKTFPEELRQMECLEELVLDDTWIADSLASFCTSSSTSKFCHIKRLFLAYCQLSEEKIPSDLSHLLSLEELDLSGNKNLSCLPASICQLPRLKYLDLSRCYKLDAMQALPSSIVVLRANNTRNFTTFPDLSIKYKSLWKISFLTGPEDSDEPGNLVLKSLLQGGHLVANHQFSVSVSGCNVPKWWFSCYSPGNSTHLPSNWYKKNLLGFALGASVCCFSYSYAEIVDIQFDLLEKDTPVIRTTPPSSCDDESSSDHDELLWLGFISFFFFQQLFQEYQPSHDWSTYEGSIGLHYTCRDGWVTSCAIRPVYKEDVERMPESSSPPVYRRPWLPHKFTRDKDIWEYGSSTGFGQAKVSF